MDPTTSARRWRRWQAALGLDPVGLSPRHRLQAVAAAAVATLLVTWTTAHLSFAPPLLVAAVGASSVLLFALPASPMAKPWALLGGYVVCALAGVSAAKILQQPAAAAALAVALALAGMLWLRCLHPPGGAVALFAVTGGESVHALGYGYVVAPVLLDGALLFAVALALNFLAGLPRRPAGSRETESDPLRRFGLSHEDVTAALAETERASYITPEDLDWVIELAEMYAWERRHGELSAGDIMCHEVLQVDPKSRLLDLWGLLRRQRQGPVLVVDSLRRIEGMVTLADFVDRAKPKGPADLRGRLVQTLTRNNMGRGDTEAASVAGPPPPQVGYDTPIAKLVPLFADGAAIVAIVDIHARLLGVVRPADLIGALYRAGSDLDRKAQSATIDATHAVV